MNDCYHFKKQIEEAMASGRLAHLVKDIRVEHWIDNMITFLLVPWYQLIDFPVVVDALIEGFRVRSIHVDGGSSLEVMYEHCFRNLSYQTRSRLKESRIPLVGFSGEVNYPIGVIDLRLLLSSIEELNALRDRVIDARVIVEAVDQEEIEMGARGPIEVRIDRVTHPVIADDIPEPAQGGAIEVTYETLGDLVQRFHDHTKEIPVHHVQAIKSAQRDLGHMIVAIGQQSADMLERIRELERDNRRLRDMIDVVSQRVTRSQRRELRVQREMRQIRAF
ncbi:hypothetical protein Tco_0879783 [Tanacetum coccineum]